MWQLLYVTFEHLGYWLPSLGSVDYRDPLQYSFDDATFAMFAEDTGAQLGIPASGEKRFQMRSAWSGPAQI